uniref:FTH domain-containing protein n=1 Tax=Caenorhabditis tropicalis TaxID=1561998 RepID=A0A1I7UV46_9PELO
MTDLKLLVPPTLRNMNRTEEWEKAKVLDIADENFDITLLNFANFEEIYVWRLSFEQINQIRMAITNQEKQSVQSLTIYSNNPLPIGEIKKGHKEIGLSSDRPDGRKYEFHAKGAYIMDVSVHKMLKISRKLKKNNRKG